MADPKLAELQALREIEEELKHLTALHLMKQPTIGTMGNDSAIYAHICIKSMQWTLLT